MGRKRIPDSERPAYLQRRNQEKRDILRRKRAIDPSYGHRPRKYPGIPPEDAMSIGGHIGGALGGRAGSREDKSRAGKLGQKSLQAARKLFGGYGSHALTPAPKRPPSLRVPKPPKPPKAPRKGPVRGPDIVLGPGESYDIRPFRRQRFER